MTGLLKLQHLVIVFNAQVLEGVLFLVANKWKFLVGIDSIVSEVLGYLFWQQKAWLTGQTFFT